MPLPILVCPCQWEATKTTTLVEQKQTLGDGYIQYMSVGMNPLKVVWKVKTPVLTRNKVNLLNDQLKDFAGIKSFAWSPDNGVSIPLSGYYCEEWEITPYAPNAFTLEAEFIRDSDSECIALSSNTDINLIKSRLEEMIKFVNNYTRSNQPFIANLQGVTVQSFHDTDSTNPYIPNAVGTSETQAVLIEGLLLARKYINNSAVGSIALNLANLYSNALIQYFYQETIPTDPKSRIWLPNWLTNSKQSFVSDGPVNSVPDWSGHFNRIVNFMNGVGIVPSGDPTWGDKLDRVYKVYSVDGKLAWQNVNAPLMRGSEYEVNYWVFKSQNIGNSYRIYKDLDTASSTTNENTGTIVLKSSFTGSLIVVYSTQTGDVINLNNPVSIQPITRPTKLNPREKVHYLASSIALDNAFKELSIATGNIQWDRARASNEYSTEIASVINPSGHLFKIDSTSNEAFLYPGTQLVASGDNLWSGVEPPIQKFNDVWVKLSDGVISTSIDGINFISRVTEISEAWKYHDSSNLNISFSIACKKNDGSYINLDYRPAIAPMMFFQGQPLSVTITSVNKTFFDNQINNPTWLPVKLTPIDTFIPSIPTASVVNGWIVTDINSWDRLDPKVELQNISTVLQIQNGVTIDVELGCSVKNIIEVYLSTSKNPLDSTKNYSYYQPVLPDVDVSTKILPSEFIKFNSGTVWHSAIKTSNVIQSYNDATSAVSSSIGLTSIDGFRRLISTINMTRSMTGYAGAVFNTTELGNKPYKIFYSKKGVKVLITHVDSQNNSYLQELPDTNGSWVLFDPGVIWNTPLPTGVKFNQIAIHTVETGNSEVRVWYVGEPPEILPHPCLTYKASVLSRIEEKQKFKVRNFKVTNSPLSIVKNNPGIIPHSVSLSQNSTGAYDMTSYRESQTSVGYQSVYMWNNWGNLYRVQQTLDFLLESQNEYYKQSTNKIFGPFIPVYTLPTWESGVYGEVNTWSFKHISDPTVTSGEHQVRILVDVARYWKDVPTDFKASSIVMKFLEFIDTYYKSTNDNKPPTKYLPLVDPITTYTSTYDSAMICRAALYANLAGGNPSVTYRVFKKSLDLLMGDYVNIGSMSGTFTKSNSDRIQNGSTIKELYPHHHGEIMVTLAEIVGLKSQITYPSCSVNLS